MTGVRFLALLVLSAGLFGVAAAAVEPYPSAHYAEIFVLAFAAYAIAGFLLQGLGRSAWLMFGVGTFACYFVPWLWFWYGAMPSGVWYPDAPHFVQLFRSVDGESSYDAMVSNLAITLWLQFAIGMGGWFAVVTSKRNLRAPTERP